MNIKSLYQIFFVVLASAIFVGCQPDEIEPIGTPLSYTEGIAGSWKLESVMLTDEIAASAEEPNAATDVTPYFNFSDYAVSFNGNNFTIEAGNAPNFINMTSGTWAFDDPNYPTKVILTDGEQTSELALDYAPKPGWKLQVAFQRYNGETLALSYKYTFVKQ